MPKAEFLDPRAAYEGWTSPISRSVNIPSADLARRRDELPSKHFPVVVCGNVDGAEEAERWLKEHGWPTQTSAGWRYRSEAEPKCRLWSPNPVLEEWLEKSPEPGAALDLGCGGGREAVTLAAEGWKVLAVDRLEENLHRGFQLADRYLEAEERRLIAWEKQDILIPAWRPQAQYDLVLSFFLFDPRLVTSALGWLQPEGILLLEAFTPRRRESHGKPSSPDRVLEPDRIPELLRGLEIVSLNVATEALGETVRVVAKRPA